MSGNLNEEEYSVLAEHRLVERIGPSKRKISSSYLSPPASSLGSTSSSSTSSASRVASASWASPPATSHNLVYPASPVSVEALEFIGLNRDTAQHIFNNLKSAAIVEGMDAEDELGELPSFIEGHLRQLFKLEDLPTAEAFSRVGLTQDTIAAILSPEFREVFETHSPFYWAWDTLYLRYNHVVLVDERIKKSAAKALLARKQKKRPKVEDIFGGAEAQSSQESGSQAHIPSGMTQSGINSTSPYLPTACTFVQSVPTPPENHLVLYTGKSPDEFHLDDNPTFVKEDGSINMDAIATYYRGDFNAQSVAWYFTMEYETADLYRSYAAKRAENVETWIIRFAIPEQLAATLRTEELWWSHDFQEFVWHNRRAVTIPERLQKYDSCDVLKGHILKYPTVRKCDESNIHTHITQDKLCKRSSGRNATQWAAKNKETVNKIAQWSRGNVHIEVFAPVVQLQGPAS